MSESLGSGGYHWLEEAHVAKWDARRRAMSAERQAGLAAMLDALPADRSTPLRILDLGAGEGLVASVIMDSFPHSTAVLVDFSELMINRGRSELGRFDGRFRYVVWDMNIGDWPADLGGEYDVVVSSAALHHLSNERKAWLAHLVIDHLARSGIFANYDLHRDPNAEFGVDEVHDRMCASVGEATATLAAAGFVGIRVAARTPKPSHKGEMALVVGQRPRAWIS
jgi:trans-aconitate methyltransferase